MSSRKGGWRFGEKKLDEQEIEEEYWRLKCVVKF